MKRLYLLDTNTVSYIVKGRSPAARARLAGLSGEDTAFISSVTEAEIHYGLAKTPGADRWRAAIHSFLDKINVLPWHHKEALVCGPLRASLEATGQPLGSLDTMIAAHAIAVDAILVTNDQAFTRVADLRAIENWATDL